MKNKDVISNQVDDSQELIPNEEDAATGVWKILKLIETAGLEIFMDENNVLQTVINEETGRTVELSSDEFKNWVLYKCFQYDKKPPGTEAINRAVKIFEYEIKSNNPKTKKLFVRVAQEAEGVYWYDLGRKAVRYDAKGWEIIEKPPVIFRRYDTQKPQVDPKSGDGLDQFINLMNLATEEDALLLKTYIICAFIPDFSHPILVIYGQAGAAKSTMSKSCKSIIDPSTTSTRSIATKQDDFTIAMEKNWSMFYDNITNLSVEQSDQMCRCSTGEGVSKRKLYSDKEEVVFNFKNILGLNGVNCVANKPDLLDRSLIIKLSRIPEHKRKTEKEINKAFEELKPYILGQCFDIVTKAIALEPGKRLKQYPRMADFAHWGYMINEASQVGGDVFLGAYNNNILTQNEKAVEVNPVAVAVTNLIKSDVVGEITGTPEYIYKKLISHARQYDLDYTHDKYWPKNSSWLIRRLEEIIPNLDKLGIRVSNYTDKGKRWTTIIDKTKKVTENNTFSSGSLLVKNGYTPPENSEEENISFGNDLYYNDELEGGESESEDFDISQIPF